MDAIEIEREVTLSGAALQELDDERAKIMSEVDERLAANRAARDKAYDDAVKRRTGIFLKTTHENFCDPLSYQVISEFAFNYLDGDESRRHVRDVLFPETYVRPELEFWGSKTLLCFGIAVPKQSDAVKLARTAELLSPVLKAATENSDDARISIMEDDCSYYASWHIIWDEEEQLFMLQGMTYYESNDLLEVLKRVPTYC